jgi:hypothetical protein
LRIKRMVSLQCSGPINNRPGNVDEASRRKPIWGTYAGQKRLGKAVATVATAPVSTIIRVPIVTRL